MNQLESYFADLKSSDPSVRYFALAEIDGNQLSSEQIRFLKELSETETEPGVSFYVQKILKRAEQTSQKSNSIIEIEPLLTNLEGNEIKLSLALESVKRSNATAVLELLRSKFWTTLPPKVLPSVLKFMKRFGTIQDSDSIESFCMSNEPRIIGAAMEALERIDPQRLKKLIVPLLLNPNFSVRSRAVRVLHRWDPNEALRHFESMLFSVTAAEKHAALFQSFFFNFTEIESLLLKFMAIEEDENLIKKVGLLFIANPSRSSPAKLLEAREASVGKKYELIHQILLGVLSSLLKAGLAQASPENMLLSLEQQFKRKKAQLSLERYSLGLKSSDPNSRLKAAAKICEIMRAGVPEARDLIKNFLEKEKNQAITDRIKIYLKKLFPPTQKDIRSFFQLSQEDRERVLSSMDEANFAALKNLIFEKFTELENKEKVLWITAVGQFGSKSESFFLQNCFKATDDEVLAATIDSLMKVDSEALLPFLPQLIKHNSDEVAITALRVFSLFDKRQAISFVETMINSISSNQRRRAIFCAGQFDFPAVSNILVKILKKENNPANLTQIIALFKANPSEELFFALFNNWKETKTSHSKNYKTSCEEVAEILSKSEGFRYGSVDGIFAEAQKRLEKEQALIPQRKNYKLEKIQKIRTRQDKKFRIDASLVRFTIVAYLIGAILTALIWFLILAPGKTDGKRKVDKLKNKNKKLPDLIILKGTVVNIFKKSKSVTVKSQSGIDYTIIVGDAMPTLPSLGAEFQGQVKITERGSGRVKARLISAF